MGQMYRKLFEGWCFCCNSSHHPGGRIIMAWNALAFHVDILLITGQMIHCHVKTVSGNNEFTCTFVYAYNTGAQRE